MKIRIGFVSNSSSSSFLIYGVRVESEAYGKLENKELPNGICCLQGPPDDDGGYIGAPWNSVKDDETGKQFKDRVAAAIAEMFKQNGVDMEKFECGTHQEAWYDG
jgi:hypothetical protein